MVKDYEKFKKIADELQALVNLRIPLKKGEHLDCPRAKSDTTPCVARDGWSAIYDNGDCVGCNENVVQLLEREKQR